MEWLNVGTGSRQPGVEFCHCQTGLTGKLVNLVVEGNSNILTMILPETECNNICI